MKAINCKCFEGKLSYEKRTVQTGLISQMKTYFTNEKTGKYMSFSAMKTNFSMGMI